MIYNNDIKKYLVIIIGLSLFFLFPFIFIYLYSFVFFFKKTRNHDYLPLLIVLFLSIILISRQQIGGSTYHQINAFLNIESFENLISDVRLKIVSYDILFWFVSYLIRLFVGDNYIFFLWFWAFFSIITIMWSYKQILPKFWIFAFLLFCSSLTFYWIPGNTIRQSAALGFFIMSIAFANNNSNKSALILAICASLCHISAFLLLPFFIILNISFKWIENKRMFFLVILSFFLSFFNFIQILSKIFYFSPHLSHKLLTYSYRLPASFISRQFILTILILLLLFMYQKKFKIDLKKYYVLISSYLYIFSLQILFSFSTVYWDRLACYKNIIQNILIVILIIKLKQKKKVLVLLIVSCFFYNLYILSNIFTNFVDGIGYGILEKNFYDVLCIAFNKAYDFYRML
ncbi:MAG: EpsG family protein [Desulfobacterales bacterium]|nr:EpsG family protein [Desulfobacterales bacterium]